MKTLFAGMISERYCIEAREGIQEQVLAYTKLRRQII